MKETIVFWGTNQNDQKIMAVLKLRANDKKVDVWTFEKDKLEDEFVEKMFEDWESIDVKTFPEATTYEERDVTESELLPETIRADKTDLIIRAEQDWRFKVLSIRVAEMLKGEIAALEEQINAADEYDKDLWESAKSYNAKIIAHSNERTLGFDQINKLRSVLNGCFEKLKALMSKNNARYEEEANANKKMATEKINNIVSKAKENNRINDGFEELKKVQKHIKEIRLTRDGRKEIWDLLNQAFTEVKGMRKSQSSNRLEARMAGLEKAINKMQQSVDMDKESVDFQNRKAGHINATKLEMQLREAKIKMIESRIQSKQVKLDDMLATMAKLKKQAGGQEAKKKETDKKQVEKKEAEKVVAANADTPKAEKAEVPEGSTETPKTEEVATPPVVESAPVESKEAEAPKENTSNEASTADNEAAAQAEEAKEETAEKSEEEIELKTEADVKPENPEDGSGQPAVNEEKPVPPVVTEDTQVAPQAVEKVVEEVKVEEVIHEAKAPEDEEE